MFGFGVVVIIGVYVILVFWLLMIFSMNGYWRYLFVIWLKNVRVKSS